MNKLTSLIAFTFVISFFPQIPYAAGPLKMKRTISAILKSKGNKIADEWNRIEDDIFILTTSNPEEEDYGIYVSNQFDFNNAYNQATQIWVDYIQAGPRSYYFTLNAEGPPPPFRRYPNDSSKWIYSRTLFLEEDPIPSLKSLAAEVLAQNSVPSSLADALPEELQKYIMIEEKTEE